MQKYFSFIKQNSDWNIKTTLFYKVNLKNREFYYLFDNYIRE